MLRLCCFHVVLISVFFVSNVYFLFQMCILSFCDICQSFFRSISPTVCSWVIIIVIIIHSFYTALFSALEQTRCAHWHVILNE